MQSIKDLLNRIKWDSKEDPDTITIGYEDRVEKNIIEIRYMDVLSVEDGFMVINNDDETSIPLHRVRHVKQNGKVIWQRPPKVEGVES